MQASRPTFTTLSCARIQDDQGNGEDRESLSAAKSVRCLGSIFLAVKFENDGVSSTGRRCACANVAVVIRLCVEHCIATLWRFTLLRATWENRWNAQKRN